MSISCTGRVTVNWSFFLVLGIELWGFWMWSTCSTTKLHPWTNPHLKRLEPEVFQISEFLQLWNIYTDFSQLSICNLKIQMASEIKTFLKCHVGTQKVLDFESGMLDLYSTFPGKRKGNFLFNQKLYEQQVWVTQGKENNDNINVPWASLFFSGSHVKALSSGQVWWPVIPAL